MPRSPKLPPGMTRRGGKYWCDFSHRGRRIRKALSTDIEVSKAMLRKERLRVEAGELDNDADFDKLVADYFAVRGRSLNPASVDAYQRRVARFTETIKPRLVSDITLDTAVEYQNARLAAGVTEDTAQRELDQVARILRWGRKQRKIASNPLADAERVQTRGRPEPIPFTAEEADAILDETKPVWRELLRLAFCTGLRRCEIEGLNVEDIDLDAMAICIPERIAKTATSVRRVPILDCIAKTIREACRGREPGERLFLGPRGAGVGAGLYWSLRRVMKRLGIAYHVTNAAGKVTARRDLHSTRRSFATWLREAGAGRELVEDLIGHRRAAVTDRYIVHGDAALRDAIGKHPWGVAVMPEGVLTVANTSHVQETETQPSCTSAVA